MVVAAVVGTTSVGVAVPIAWKATNALYEFFVVFLFLVLVLGVILGSTGLQFCLVGVIVVLSMVIFVGLY